MVHAGEHFASIENDFSHTNDTTEEGNMNDHFVQSRYEQGALVNAAPDSDRTAPAIDTGRRFNAAALSRAEGQHLLLPVRMAHSDSGNDIQPALRHADNLLSHSFRAGGTPGRSGTDDTGSRNTASATGSRVSPENQDHSTSENPAPSALPGGQRRILIVDDNVDAAESLGELLKVCGHDIHIAHDGASAISEALRLRPEAVILDIGLPAMNGYEVAQRLRLDVGLNASLLVALTGYAEDSDRISAEKAGFDHYFAKPLDINKLVTVLDNLK